MEVRVLQRHTVDWENAKFVGVDLQSNQLTVCSSVERDPGQSWQNWKGIAKNNREIEGTYVFALTSISEISESSSLNKCERCSSVSEPSVIVEFMHMFALFPSSCCLRQSIVSLCI